MVNIQFDQMIYRQDLASRVHRLGRDINTRERVGFGFGLDLDLNWIWIGSGLDPNPDPIHGLTRPRKSLDWIWIGLDLDPSRDMDLEKNP